MNAVYAALNLIFIVLFAPLLDGIERKVKARLQSRQGPPLIQTWLDLLKLFRRPNVRPRESVRWLFEPAPAIALVSVLAASLFIPSLLPGSLDTWGDIIAFIYLSTLSAVAIALGAFSTGSPYAQIGSHREVSIIMAEEFSLAFIVAALAASSGGLSFSRLFPLQLKVSTITGALAFAVMAYVAGARIPFDVAEAEPEIVEGPFIEFSGKGLGMLKLSIYVKRLLLTTILLNFFLPQDGTVRVLVYVIGLVIISVVYASIEAHYGRFRTKDAARFLKRFAIVGILSWILGVVGW